MRLAPGARALALLAVAAVVLAGRPAEAQEPPAGEAGASSGKLEPPRLKTFVEADYPPEQKKAGVTAEVVMSVEVDAEGKVGEVVVTESGGAAFDAAAVAAVHRFVFEPARVDGEPIPVKFSYTYKFVIREEMVSAGPQVNLEGVVLERFKKQPMARVKVAVKELGVSAETDETGAFAFTDVPPGTYHVELASPKLITVTTEETIQKGKKKTLKLFVEEKPEDMDDVAVIKSPRIRKESVETTIRAEVARKVPGTTGDIGKVVQNLPGVGRSAFGSGALVVWGSAPTETRVNVDGVDVPALYHVGGLRSTINGDLIKTIDLAPGAYGAAYGRGLGGLVRVETKGLPTQGVHGYVAADVIDTSAMLTVAPTPKLRFGIAGRQSYLDRSLRAVSSRDVGDFVPIPRYDDYQAVASATLRKDEELSVMLLASDDHLKRSIPSDDPAAVRSENTESLFRRVIVRYTRLLPDGASFFVTPSFGYDRSSSDAAFGAVPTLLETRAWTYGVRGAYRRKLAAPATLTLGMDFQGASTAVTRRGSVSLPPREGDVTVFGQPPGDDVNADDWRANIASVAPYAFTEINLGRLSITPGLRLEPYLIDGSRLSPRVGDLPAIGFERVDVAAEPRLSLAFRPTPRLSASLGAGIYHQAPQPEDLSAVFGNPTLDLLRAYHLTTGVAYKLTGTLTLETVGFYKTLDDLVSRSASPTPPLARALTQDGVGRSYGGQVLLRQELVKGLFGWITYSLIRSERRDHPGQAWRLFDYDQTHVLGVLASYALGHGFELGGRFRYTTGVPRTPVVGAFYDARDDQFQPVFGAHNSIRIPAFYQLDARLERSVALGRSKLDLFLDVQNVTNRRNAEEIIYNYSFTRREYITGLPTLAVLGARLEF